MANYTFSLSYSFPYGVDRTLYLFKTASTSSPSYTLVRTLSPTDGPISGTITETISYTSAVPSTVTRYLALSSSSSSFTPTKTAKFLGYSASVPSAFEMQINPNNLIGQYLKVSLVKQGSATRSIEMWVADTGCLLKNPTPIGTNSNIVEWYAPERYAMPAGGNDTSFLRANIAANTLQNCYDKNKPYEITCYAPRDIDDWGSVYDADRFIIYTQNARSAYWLSMVPLETGWYSFNVISNASDAVDLGLSFFRQESGVITPISQNGTSTSTLNSADQDDDSSVRSGGEGYKYDPGKCVYMRAGVKYIIRLCTTGDRSKSYDATLSDTIPAQTSISLFVCRTFTVSKVMSGSVVTGTQVFNPLPVPLRLQEVTGTGTSLNIGPLTNLVNPRTTALVTDYSIGSTSNRGLSGYYSGDGLNLARLLDTDYGKTY